MEHEIRFYLKAILIEMEKTVVEESTEQDVQEIVPKFMPQYIVTAVKLPTGAIEIAVNNSHIKEKIKYILENYDEDMRLKTNKDVSMQNIMVV